MKSSELETLLGYAEKFLGRVRSSITLDEFRIYLRNLDEDISTLTDSDAATRISMAVNSVKKCDYVFRNNPDMKESIVFPVVEALVIAIRNEMSASAY